MNNQEKAAAIKLLDAVDAIHTEKHVPDWNDPQYPPTDQNISWMFTDDGKKVFKTDDVKKALDGVDTGHVYTSLIMLDAVRNGCDWGFDFFAGIDPAEVKKIVPIMCNQIIANYDISDKVRFWFNSICYLYSTRGYNAIADSLELQDLLRNYAPDDGPRLPVIA